MSAGLFLAIINPACKSKFEQVHLPVQQTQVEPIVAVQTKSTKTSVLASHV